MCVYERGHTHTNEGCSKSSVLSFLDLSHTSHLCMGLTCIEIKTEIWISFSSFLRGGTMLPQQKCLAMAVLSGEGLELFVQPLQIY